jgi:predicted ATPase/class 3 adenylate cyclase
MAPARRHIAGVESDMTERPSGTVSFLATDIEQSTRRWEEKPDEMRIALARHDRLMTKTIEKHGGWLFKHTGDGVMAAFASPRAAIEAAIEAQRQLDLPVRMGICTGEAEVRDNDYFGPTLNRAARTMAAGHGGQVLVAGSTAAIVAGFDLAYLGDHRLRDLAQPQRLFQLRADGLKEVFPPLKTLNAAIGNLPAQTTSFLGRDRDLAEVAALLGGARLVTLTGVGGVGKTRLAIQAAADASPDYPDGVWMVEFAALGEAASTGHAVAAALGITQQPGKTIEQSVSASLAGRRLLVVLDNCEHLIDAVADLARQILAQCPQVVLLATSREALAIGGERIWPVASLAFRDGNTSPAVQLFVERARSVVPDFALGDDSDAVCEICRRLDGIPLAIELAAARTRAMSPSQIRDRLDERFRLLTGGSRRALERHQTLRHAVQWSYDLLTPAEKVALSRVSVFAGGFTLKAAEQVCSGDDIAAGDILDILDSLVRKSLIIVDRSGDGLRYGLLETIRQFAQEQLGHIGEDETVRIRHAQYFAGDSDAQFAIWLSPRQFSAYQWLDDELDNLRSAFRWANDRGNVDIAARIASNVGDMARFRLRDEAANWAAEIVDAARTVRHRRLPVLLTWAASSAWSFGRLEEAKRLGAEAISLADHADFDPFVWAFTDLAMVASFEGHAEQAVELARAGSEHPADRHDRFCKALLLSFMAASGESDAAIEIANGVLAEIEATGIPSSVAAALWARGEVFAEADPAEALAAYQRAVAVARQSGNRFWETLVTPKAAALQARRGDPIGALRSLLDVVNSWHRSTDLMFVSHGLGGLIVLFDRLGHATAAATLNGALTAMIGSTAFLQELPDTIGRVRGMLGDTAFDAADKRGAAMTFSEASSYASGQVRQALAALGAGDAEGR